MNIEREELYGYLGFQSSTCHYGDKFRQKLIIKKSVSATTADEIHQRLLEAMISTRH